ncbi:MAG: DUF4290 domain-containing protein [Prevotellaceae bacterium]|nr:DUF4290 domain-containing protein [Candidatus Faecinaster equi]
MIYNTNREKLLLPEYGRSIQNMVNEALTIEDKSKRQLCAENIIRAMGNKIRELKELPDFNQLLWDHLALMSGYKLDVDYPYEIRKEDEFQKNKVDYPNNKIKIRQYGILVQKTLDYIIEMPDGEDKELLIKKVANQMAKCLYECNKNGLDANRISNDISLYTEGKVKCPPENIDLNSVRISGVIKDSSDKKKNSKR